jgi:hypothetical protein
VSINGGAAVRLPRVALAAQAKHKGRVVVVGDYSVELVADGDVVHAYVLDAAAKADANVNVSIRVGPGAFVVLVWDPASTSYRAKLDGKVDLDAVPIAIGVKANGKAFVGATVPRPSADAKGKAEAKVDLNVDPKIDAKLAAAERAKANAKANVDGKVKTAVDAKANVKPPAVNVTPPKVDFSVKGGVNLGAK